MPRIIGQSLKGLEQQSKQRLDTVEEIRIPTIPVPPSIGSLALEYTRFGMNPVRETTSYIGPNDFELTTTDVLRDSIKAHGFGATRKEFGVLVEGVFDDPFGVTCIDSFSDTDAGQSVRLVHEITGPLANLVPGKRLAIKGTGLDMERGKYLGARRTGLREQFRNTLRAQRAQACLAPEGINSTVFVNEVYGVVSYRSNDGTLQEWMIMEYIEDGVPLDQFQLVVFGGGTTPGFDRQQYPLLTELIDSTHPWQNTMGRDSERFEDLAKIISEQLDLKAGELDDLNGNNILEQQTDYGPRYTIIDLQSH